MKKQQGFTIIELIIVVMFLGAIAFIGWFGYHAIAVVEHFIIKYW